MKLLQILVLVLLTCVMRDNDPNDASKGQTRVSDCNNCNCRDSSNYGNHNMYNGTCLTCGASG